MELEPAPLENRAKASAIKSAIRKFMNIPHFYTVSLNIIPTIVSSIDYSQFRICFLQLWFKQGLTKVRIHKICEYKGQLKRDHHHHHQRYILSFFLANQVKLMTHSHQIALTSSSWFIHEIWDRSNYFISHNIFYILIQFWYLPNRNKTYFSVFHIAYC